MKKEEINYTSVITEAKQARKQLEQLNTEHNGRVAIIDKKESKEYDRHWKLERKIEKQHVLALSKFEREREKLDKQREMVVAAPSGKIALYERIMGFLEIGHEDRDLEFSPETREGEVQLLDTIRNDKYMIMRVYLLEQRKPKNKFAIVICATSIFYGHKNLIEYPHSYGSGMYNDGNIYKFLREAPTKEELLSWYSKQYKSTLWDFTEHDAICKEYEDVLLHCNTKTWHIAYWKNKKNYYEKRVVRGQECEEYPIVLKELEKLTGKKQVAVTEEI